MKWIRKIYSSDLKKVFNNWVAGLIVIVLCILPSLYARFYLKSSWDPYGNTKGLKVAVVNNDKGTLFRDSFLNIGADVVEELKKNNDIGWIFVDEEIAKEGTRLGKYYANIIIESGFSEKMTTLLDEIPQHPEIHYTVNEKLNAIAPKITEKGASTIKDNIQKSFIDTVNQVLMEKLNLVGFDIKKDKSRIERFVDFIHNSREYLEDWDEKLDRIIDATNRSKNELQKINNKIPDLYESISRGKSIMLDTSKLSQDSLALIQRTPKKIRENTESLNRVIEDIDSDILRLLNNADDKSKDLTKDIQPIIDKLSQLEKKLSLENQFLKALKVVIMDYLPNALILKPLDSVILKIDAFYKKVVHVRETLIGFSAGIREGVEVGIDARKALKGVAGDFRSTMKGIRSDIDNDILPQFESILVQLGELSTRGVDRLDTIEGRLPDLQREIYSGMDLLDSGQEKLQEFKKDLPQVQEDVGALDDTLQDLRKKKVLDDLISLATLNPDIFSDFISEPVELVEHKLFSIPNYGSAMSPFFTVLAIWVGSLLNISLFTTKIKEKRFYHCKQYQKFFGKWLFFLTIALIQGMIVALGDMFLLGAYVYDVGAFITSAVLIAIVFSMVIYSTVATFGNAGKAIVVVFLVLQLSGAGGTFPIELSGGFFKMINPFLPFTYAIAAMRESVGGVVPQVFYPNLLILFGFFGLFLLIGLILRPLIAGKVAYFDYKFSQSELGEH